MSTHLLIEYHSYTQTVEMVYIFFERMSEHYSRLEVKKVQANRIKANLVEWADIVLAIRSTDLITTRLAKQCKRSGKLFAYLIDDNLFLHRIDEFFKRRRIVELRKILNETDVIFTGNEYLFQYICKQSKGTKRWIKIDTAVEKEEITKRKFEETGKKIKKLVYYSSDGSFHDFMVILEPIIKKISEKIYPIQMELYLLGIPKETFSKETIGTCKVKLIPHMGLEDFRNFMINEKFDVGLAPLKNNDDLRKCKYFNKYMEFSTAAIPGVYSYCSPYTMVVNNEENGFLCKTAEEWRMAIELLLTSTETQQRIVDNAQEILKTNFSSQIIEKTLIDQFPEILVYQSSHKEKINMGFVKYHYIVFCTFEKIFAVVREFRKGGMVSIYKRMKIYINTKKQAHQAEMRSEQENHRK